MACDSYFGIGDKHPVCQDYALHGTLFGCVEYVIVADGCSSAKYSEIGAQILCHAAKYQIALCYQTGLLHECSISTLENFIRRSVRKRVHSIRMNYPINSPALEATLLIAFKFDEKVFVFGWGDGVIIKCYRLRDGSDYLVVHDLDYSNNAPYYLVYDIIPYIQQQRERGCDKPEVIYTNHFCLTENKRKEIKSYSAEKPYCWSLPEDETLVSITVCSDGVKSFQDIDKNPIDIMQIVSEIVGYKSTEGEFVKKRMFFLNRKAKQNNWSHYDDISCGTILLN